MCYRHNNWDATPSLASRIPDVLRAAALVATDPHFGAKVPR
jgi:hypothetical protein